MSLSAQLFGRDSFIFKATNALGLGIPGWLDKKFGPKDTEGPRLEDLSVQTSTYGADIPRLYGTISMAGNILWLEGGKLKEVVKKNKKGGKGGASTTPTKTYTYFATFALGLCEGPIAGVRRIWCSDTLLYNAGSDDLETIIASNANAKGWKLYLGSEDQQPDARYEADAGAGNAPAFRGLAYLVFYDFELTDYANTLQASQFKVEIVTKKSTSPVEVYKSSANPTNGPQGLLINVANDEIARVMGEGEDDVIWVHRASSVSKEKYTTTVIDAYQMREPVLATGDAEEVRLFWTGSAGLVRTEDTTFRGLPFTSSSLHFTIRIVNGECYGLWGGVAGNGGQIHKCKDSLLASSDSSDYIAFDVYNGYVYAASNEEKVDVLLSDDLSLVRSIYPDFSQYYQFPSFYIQVYKGVLYALPINTSPVMTGVSLIDGSTVYKVESEHFEADDNSTIGQPGAIKNGLLIRQMHAGSYASTIQAVRLFGLDGGALELSDVIEQECLLSTSLSISDIDVGDINEKVIGYKVASGTIRSALEPLQSAYPFDVIQSGYQVKFRPRGQASALSILLDELYAGDDGGDDALSQSREMDSQLPNRIVIKYLDADREYDVSQQQYQRASTASVDESSRDLSLVLTADKAAQIAEILCYLAWLERLEFSFTLPPLYVGIEPSDIITLYDDSVSYELRITETTQGIEGRTECKAVPNRASLYTSQAKGGTGVTSGGVISLPGKSVAVLLDIPVIDESIQNDPGFVAALTGYTSGWPGAVLIGSSDNGQTYTDLQGFAGKGTFGTVTGSLAANGGTLIDMASIGVSLISGQLESVTRDRMLSGVNYAAYGIDGRWEIVRFQNALLQSDGTYLVSGFLRGQRGTEWATGKHEDGDWFVLLDDPDNAFIDLPASALAETRLYKAVTSRQSADDAIAQALTYKGVNLQPLSPLYARGSRNSGSLTVTWTRRSRLSNSWWTTGVVAPLGEASESYQVDVMSGSTVVRTLSSTSAAITYTAAQQQTDFGSVQTAITFRIFQLSAAVGRGRALEVTL
jgi:hypothetical protein